MASRTKKIFIGCAIGCGGLLLIALFGVVGFFSWLGRPGELLQPGRLMGEDTVGYAEWTLRLEDPGTRAFVEDLFERVQGLSNAQSPFPQELRGFLEQMQRRNNRRNLEQLFPMVAAWTLRAGDEETDDHQLWSISLRSIGNRLVFADWVLGLTFWRGDELGDHGEFQRIEYRDESLYRIEFPDAVVVFFLRGNDVFFTGDLDTARQAIDRLQPTEGTPNDRLTPLAELFAGTPSERPMRGALRNDRGEIYRLWESIAREIERPDRLRGAANELRGATLTGSLADDDSIVGRVGLWCPDAAWATAYAAEALRQFQAGMDYEGIDLTATVTAENDRIWIDFQVNGVLEGIGTALDRSADSGVRDSTSGSRQ